MSQEVKITDLLDEEVKEEIVEKNTQINDSDFLSDEDLQEEEDPETDREEEDPEEEEDPDPDTEEEDSEEEEEEEPEPKNAPPVQTEKQKAIVNQAKKRSSMFFVMYNFGAKRAGKVFSPHKPDHFKIIGEDKEDMQEMLNSTIEEENWSGVKSKWFFMAGFILLIAERVMTIKRPAELPSDKDPEGNKSEPGTGMNNKQMEMMQKLIDQLQEQNKLYRDMLDARQENKSQEQENFNEKYSRMRFYKGYDLSKISFSKNGAIKDPSKAGQQGYTNEGVKMGAIGNDVRDIKRHWDLFREFVLKHDISIEEAEIID